MTDKRHYPALDLLRTIAIALVFTIHLRVGQDESWFKTIGPVGWVGVDLFFVLSGFLITNQLLKIQASGQISYPRFFVRRALRIWPAFFAVYALYYFFPSIDYNGVSLLPFWRFATFTQNFGLDYRLTGTFSHAWSICIEEHFYLILPLFLIFFRNIHLKWLAGLMVLGCALRFHLWDRYLSELYANAFHAELGALFCKYIYFPTYTHFDGLLVGVGVASIYQRNLALWEICARSADRFLCSGLAVLIVSYFAFFDQHSMVSSTFAFPVVSVGFGCLTIAAISPHGLFSKMRTSFFSFPAKISYSFYLTHIATIYMTRMAVNHYGIPDESVFFPIVMLAICIVVSAVLYFTIERTGLKLRDYLEAKHR